MQRKIAIAIPMILGVTSYIYGLISILFAIVSTYQYLVIAPDYLTQLVLSLVLCVMMPTIGTILIRTSIKILRSKEVSPTVSTFEKSLMVAMFLIFASFIFQNSLYLTFWTLKLKFS